MVPVPTLYDQPATQADSHTFVLPRMERDDEQVRRAMEFIKSMLDQSLTWAEGGHIPAYLPTLQSQEYKDLKPQSDYVAAADTVVFDAPGLVLGFRVDLRARRRRTGRTRPAGSRLAGGGAGQHPVTAAGLRRHEESAAVTGIVASRSSRRHRPQRPKDRP